MALAGETAIVKRSAALATRRLPEHLRAGAWLHHPHWLQLDEDIPEWIDQDDEGEVENWHLFSAFIRWNSARENYLWQKSNPGKTAPPNIGT